MVHSLADALAACAGDTEAFVIGGAEIYREALPLADRMYLTEVMAEYPGDVRFPALGPEWREISREEPTRATGEVRVAYAVFERIPQAATPAAGRSRKHKQNGRASRRARRAAGGLGGQRRPPNLKPSERAPPAAESR